MKKHKISWLNVPGYIPQTWNPVVGCSKISEGCRNCYAERMANRLAAMGTEGYDSEAVLGGQWTGQTVLVKSALQKPLHWKKPRAIFVNSMGDLFHENIDPMHVARVFAVIEQCPQHLFIILTKRAERMARMMRPENWLRPESIPFKNVWLGVTAENQSAADDRIPHLLRTPAAVRFVSCEPLLGEIEAHIPQGCRSCNHPGNVSLRDTCTRCGGSGREPSVDWMIVGGESGPGARPMNPEWARSLRDQAQEAGVPFFFKQWGDNIVPSAYESFPLQNASIQGKHGGDFIDGRQWHEWPEKKGGEK